MCGFFNVPQSNHEQGLWDRTYDLSSLSEKTRKSNHLQMSLQRQHFLLSYLKTLSVGPAGVWTHDLPHGSLVLYQLSQPFGGIQHRTNSLLIKIGDKIVWGNQCWLPWMKGSWDTYLAPPPPHKILQGQMTSSPTWQRRENLGLRSSNALPNPVLIITSFQYRIRPSQLLLWFPWKKNTGCTLKTKELMWLTGIYERFMFFLSLRKQMEKL